jgi:hypothetical protein
MDIKGIYESRDVHGLVSALLGARESGNLPAVLAALESLQHREILVSACETARWHVERADIGLENARERGTEADVNLALAKWEAAVAASNEARVALDAFEAASK